MAGMGVVYSDARPQCHLCSCRSLLPAVVCDLVHQMMDESCLLEVFKYQPVYDRNDLKTVFERLAHSSIMKMNSASMDKVCNMACQPSNP